VFNIVHDLLQHTYCEEKVARSNTAAIFLEQKAQKDLGLDSSTTNDLNLQAFKAGIKTEFVRFDEDGNTTLIQDGLFPPIMEAVKVVHCSDCHLPRFPYPTTGQDSQVPDPGVEYCKKHVFVNAKPADIYDQIYACDNKPGKGKPKNKIEGSQKIVQDRSIKCPMRDCTKTEKMNRMAHHLAYEHGNQTGRRGAHKDALAKIKGSGSGNASSGSRKSTPAPNGRSSPKKRDNGEIDSDESPQLPKKPKSAPVVKKPHPNSQSSSQHSNSNLNRMETQLSDDDSVDEDDDDRDGDFGSMPASLKKKKSPPKTTKPKAKPTKQASKNGGATFPEKKKAANTTTSTKKARSATPSEPKAKVNTQANGNTKKKPTPRGSSESSQTMSSPTN
jgi:hypothetical protein